MLPLCFLTSGLAIPSVKVLTPPIVSSPVVLTFPAKEINKLYYELQSMICPYLEDRTYYIKSWLNVFRKGQKIDWHDHWSSKLKVSRP